MEIVENGTSAEGLYGGRRVHNGKVLYQEGVEFGHATKLGREGMNLKQENPCESIDGNIKYQILHCIIYVHVHAIETVMVNCIYTCRHTF